MLLNLYFTILIIIILVHMNKAIDSINNSPEIINPFVPDIKSEILRLLREVNQVNKEQQNDQHIFDNIYERSSTTEKNTVQRENNIKEMKTSLLKLLNKVNKMEDINNNRAVKDVSDQNTLAPSLSTTLITKFKENSIVLRDKKKRNHSDKWGTWTDWSSCSVTCGKGRKIRWRHCASSNCEAETEMQEITCQLPACSPAKLFGVIPV